MDNFENILKFIDGSIDSDSEAKLFSELAQNDQLRNEFQRHLEIEKQVNLASDNFSVPNDSTLNVFNAIGSTKVAAVPFSQRLFDKINSINPILAASVASIFTFLLLFTWPEDDNQNIIYTNNDIPNYNLSKIIIELPEIEKESISRSIFTNKAEQSSYKSDILPVSSNVHKNHKLIQAIASDITYSERKFVKYQDQPTLSLSDDKVTSTSLAELLDYEINNSENNLSGFINKISLETFINTERHFPKPNLKADDYENFRNMGIALYYELDENIQLGAEIRKETFFQKFEDEKYFYYQRPNLSSYSLILKYTFSSYFNFSPSARLALGGNKAGFLARPQLSIDYNIKNIAKLSLGLEYSHFQFFHSDKQFSSNKIGLFYGINFKL